MPWPTASGPCARRFPRCREQEAGGPARATAEGDPAGQALLLLDEALGNGFALLARRGLIDTRRPDLTRLKALVDLKIVQFADAADARCIGDAEGRLRQWFDSAGVDFVLIRPDRYIFDAGRAGALGEVLSGFLAGFPAPAASAGQLQVAA